ncbi:hypothetical protein GA0115253_101446 [Streptomyces sp. Termitarium-T10T-6]|nr:hypothetical protein GA0115253_101446 [Streptomyces sp. Termitarium-T10T-6]
MKSWMARVKDQPSISRCENRQEKVHRSSPRRISVLRINGTSVRSNPSARSASRDARNRSSWVRSSRSRQSSVSSGSRAEPCTTCTALPSLRQWKEVRRIGCRSTTSCHARSKCSGCIVPVNSSPNCST